MLTELKSYVSNGNVIFILFIYLKRGVSNCNGNGSSAASSMGLPQKVPNALKEVFILKKHTHGAAISVILSTEPSLQSQ